MKNFRVHYSGACFEKGDSSEQVEKRVQDQVASHGEMSGIEATFLHPDLNLYNVQGLTALAIEKGLINHY